MTVENISWFIYTAYLVCETQIAWLQSAKENFSNLLVNIELASAKPNKEWSVNTAFNPIVLAWNIASWAIVENAYKQR